MTGIAAVVVPNWNGADFITECIDALLRQTHPATIIVVENGSTDNSIEKLNGYGSKITLLKQDRNWGFAGGVNIGIKYSLNAGFRYIALLNNDAVADPNWLEQLVKELDRDANVGIATSKILIGKTDLIDSTGDWYTTTGMPFPRGRGEHDRGQYDGLTDVFGASGGASLYRSQLFKEIGLFDEDFFAYYEDVDVSFRAQLRGWKIHYVPRSIVHHKLSATSSKMGDFTIYQSAKNFWLIYIKNLPTPLLFRFLPAALYRYCRMFAARVIRFNGIRAFLRGYLQSLRLIPSKLQERKQIQGSQTVSVEYIKGIIYKGKPPVVKL